MNNSVDMNNKSLPPSVSSESSFSLELCLYARGLSKYAGPSVGLLIDYADERHSFLFALHYWSTPVVVNYPLFPSTESSPSVIWTMPVFSGILRAILDVLSAAHRPQHPDSSSYAGTYAVDGVDGHEDELGKNEPFRWRKPVVQEGAKIVQANHAKGSP